MTTHPFGGFCTSTLAAIGAISAMQLGCGSGQDEPLPPGAQASGAGAGSSGSAEGTATSGVTGTGGSAGTTGGGGAGPPGPSNFAERCSAPGVVRCVGFDSASDLAGTWGDVSGSLPGDAVPEIVADVKASGAGALRFTIPSNSSANSSGSYFTNFADDLSVQFGENAVLFVQWRQRFSPEHLATYYEGGGGWKHAIVGTGDKPGCTASTSATGFCSTSCTSLEVVTANTFQRGFAQLYNSCSGSTSHGPYAPFEEAVGSSDFKLQNARPDPYCLYSQGSTDPSTYFPPSGNCLGYAADQWMTFQVEIATGPRVGDEWVDSHVKLWIAYEGKPSELAIDWGPYALTAGDPGEDQKFGKVWLLPYHTGKDASQSHPIGYTWYDELVVSTEQIADPI